MSSDKAKQAAREFIASDPWFEEGGVKFPHRAGESLAKLLDRYALERQIEEAVWWHERFAVEERYGCCKKIAELRDQLERLG